MNIKIIPGLNNSGPEHWQTIWEKKIWIYKSIPRGMGLSCV
jgi:predicted alpha/beta hydrolase family esterase